MNKLSSGIITLAILLLSLFPQKAFPQDRVRNVVIFFSYNSTLPAFQRILEGFKSEISKSSGVQINLIIEYLDILRSENEEYPRFIIDLYKKKFKEIKIDLFITVGPGINSLLMKYGRELLSSVPVINIDIETPGRITLQDLDVKNGIDIGVKFKVCTTIKEAIELFPDYKNVYIISGSSTLDTYFAALTNSCKNEFGSEYTFRFLTGMTIDSTIRIVRRIDRKSIIIVTTYQLDGGNVVFSTPEVINMISDNSVAPVFPLTEAYLQDGTGIGGYLFNFTNLGKEAGRISLKILNGQQVRDISVNESSFYQHIYDWQELKKWHLLNSDALPKDSLFYNKDTSFFSEYKWYIIGLFLFLVTQFLLIIFLIRSNRRQKAITARMVETEIMYRELVRADRMALMTELTASLSHELNQPLTAILYSAQAGIRFLQSDKLDREQAEEIFYNIIDDDKRAGEIISSVKNLMKIESRGLEKTDMNVLVQETIKIISSDAIRHGIKVDALLETVPLFVLGDRIQLQQVLMNLIRNATSSMENNELKNKILQIIVKSDNDSVIISVCDSGSGIDGNIKEKIFNPFVTNKAGGTGIGLALSRTIIEKHNGEIWADNIPGGGAQFSFRLHTIENESGK